MLKNAKLLSVVEKTKSEPLSEEWLVVFQIETIFQSIYAPDRSGNTEAVDYFIKHPVEVGVSTW